MSVKHTGTVQFSLDPANPPALTIKQRSRLLSIQDKTIQHSDIPSQTNVSWTRPGALVPIENKQQLTVRLDADVLAFFKSTGNRYQSRINAALREYMNTHKTAL